MALQDIAVDRPLKLGPSMMQNGDPSNAYFTCTFDFQPEGMKSAVQADLLLFGAHQDEVKIIPDLPDGANTFHYEGQVVNASRHGEETECVAIFDGTEWTLQVLNGHLRAKHRPGIPEIPGYNVEHAEEHSVEQAVAAPAGQAHAHESHDIDPDLDDALNEALGFMDDEPAAASPPAAAAAVQAQPQQAVQQQMTAIPQQMEQLSLQQQQQQNIQQQQRFTPPVQQQQQVAAPLQHEDDESEEQEDEDDPWAAYAADAAVDASPPAVPSAAASAPALQPPSQGAAAAAPGHVRVVSNDDEEEEEEEEAAGDESDDESDGVGVEVF